MIGGTDRGTADPQWRPTPAERLLTLVADVEGNGHNDNDNDLFLAACEVAASEEGGLVSVNTVPRVLADAGVVIEPRRYSALWNVNTGSGRAMRWHGPWEVRVGSPTRNDGKPIRIREWVGANATDHMFTTEAA